MKVIIAGSRGIEDYAIIEKAMLESGLDLSAITEVVSGTARGVDQLGEYWAFQRGIPVKRFPAQWDLYGREAGFVRNEEMAHYADALVAIQKNNSHGTQHMINFAEKVGLKVFVYHI